VSESATVSIIMPTYNGSAYIEQAIESCLAQSHAHWELIIVDDGSTDDTPERIARYVQRDGRIRSVRHSKNRHVAAALNTGFSCARAEYLTWTSDDNYYRPDALAAMVGFLEADPHVGLVYAGYTEVDEDGAVLGYCAPAPPVELLRKNPIRACFLYRRQVRDALGDYAEDLALVEDYDYWLRASVEFVMAPLDRDLYVYRTHPASLTAQDPDVVSAAFEKALARNLPQIPWASPGQKARTYLHLARRAWWRRDPVDVLKWAVQAVGIGRVG
jgi:glycosyltransferase involved in cell wall biosynthesis